MLGSNRHGALPAARARTALVFGTMTIAMAVAYAYYVRTRDEDEDAKEEAALRPGSQARALWKTGKKWYTVTVLAVNDDGTYSLKY